MPSHTTYGIVVIAYRHHIGGDHTVGITPKVEAHGVPRSVEGGVSYRENNTIDLHREEIRKPVDTRDGRVVYPPIKGHPEDLWEGLLDGSTREVHPSGPRCCRCRCNGSTQNLINGLLHKPTLQCRSLLNIQDRPPTVVIPQDDVRRSEGVRLSEGGARYILVSI